MVTAEAPSISAAAQATGLSAHTLRPYERAGLMLDPVERAPSSHRRLQRGRDPLGHAVTRLPATGMHPRLRRLVRAGDGNEEERLALLEAHRAAVLEQLELMRANLDAIEFKIDRYLEQAC